LTTQRKSKRRREIQESLLSANVGCLLIFVLLVGMPIVGLGAFFVHMGRSTLLEQARLNEKAVSVKAIVLSSEVRQATTRIGTDASDTATSYWPEVEFSYEYGGTSRTSNKIWPVGEGGSEADAKVALSSYPEGAEVSAFVDPSDPGTAFLEKRWSQAPYLSVIIGVFPTAFIAGLGILLAGWKRPHLALLVSALTAMLILAVTGLAGEHYLRFMPDDQRPWWTTLAFGLSLPIALIPMAAYLKASQLHRLHLEALQEPPQTEGPPI
jgi:hypothetical protein